MTTTYTPAADGTSTIDEVCPHKPRFTGTTFVFLAKFCERCGYEERVAETMARYNEAARKWNDFVKSLKFAQSRSNPTTTL